MSFIDKLKDFTISPEECCGDPLYLLDEIKSISDKFIELDSNHWLAFKVSMPYNDLNPIDIKECWLDFAMFSFAQSNLDDRELRVNKIFQGSGPTSSLKELRHMNWGSRKDCEGGYLFYLPIDATIKALTILKEYFEE